MKVKVIRDFIDKYTHKLRRVGEEMEIDEKRFKEIQSVGNLVVKTEETVEKTEKPVKGKSKKE